MNSDDMVLIEEHICNRLSLKVFAKDDFTDGEPIGKVDVTIEGCKRKAMKKGSFYLFTDILEDTYNIIIKAEYYFDSSDARLIGIKIPEYNPNSKAQICLGPVYLIPKPSYPFPPGSTLVRGVARVKDSGSLTVSLPEFDGQINEKGEYVLYISYQKIRNINNSILIKNILGGKIKFYLDLVIKSKDKKLNEEMKNIEIEIGKTKIIKGD